MGKGGQLNASDTVWRESQGGKAVRVPRAQIPEKRKLREVTMEELARHDTEEDGWVAIDGYAYAIPRGFIQKHPGGRLPVARMLGHDATAPFINYHPANVYDSLKHFMVGKIVDFPEFPVATAYHAATQELLERGLFETKASFYVTKTVWIGSLFAAALWLTLAPEGAFWRHMAGAVMWGLFWQQLAFIGHDIGHSAISHRIWVDNVFGILIGNLLGGISIGWWKRSHNVHHIVCNSIENDPDIQHMPIFAVTERIFGKWWSTYHEKEIVTDAVARFLVSYQHYLFYPVMALARFNLYAQSWILLLSRERVHYKPLEMLCLLGFAGWFGALTATMPGWGERVAFLLLSHGVSGFLHVQICISHFAMHTYTGMAYNDESDEWFRMQLATSMNVQCPEMLDWVHGGLQFQIEHHLWPRLPRHNLREARKLTMKICKDHGIHYHSPGFVQANRELIEGLRATAMEARRAKRGAGGFYESALWEGLNARG